MANEIDITLKATDQASGVMRKAANETDAVNAALLRLAQNEAAERAANKADIAFSQMTASEKEAILETNRLAQEQKKLAAEVEKAAEKEKQAAAARAKNETFTARMSQASQLYTNIISSLGQAQQTYNQVIDSTVGKTASYSLEVANLARLSGTSVEESSRVIQTFDDLGVSTSQLEMATKKLAGEGITLSIDALAKLSDEYLALAPGAERSAFLTDKFGRAGLDMAKAMEQGGAALRQMASEQSGALILTQRQVDAYEAWRLSVDAAEDATAGIAAAIGNVLTPAVTEFNNAWAEGLSGWASFITGASNQAAAVQRTTEILNEQGLAMNRNSRHTGAMKVATEEQIAAAREQAVAELTATQAVEQHADASEQDAESIKAQEEALQRMTQANQDYIAFVESVASAESAYSESMVDLTAQKAKAQEKYNALVKQGYQSTAEGSVLGNALAEIESIDQKITETADNYEEQMNRMIAADLLKGLSTGGLTDAETAYYQQIQLQMGLITQEQIDQANKVRAEVDALLAAAPGAQPGGLPVPAEAGADSTQTGAVAQSYAQQYDESRTDIVRAADDLQQKFVEKANVSTEQMEIEIDNLEKGSAQWAIYKKDVMDNLNALNLAISEYIEHLYSIPKEITTVLRIIQSGGPTSTAYYSQAMMP